MNKLFVLPAGEDWIVDRFVNEWRNDNFDMNTNNPYDADVIWLMASWCWQHLPLHLLSTKKVVATIHHIYLEKFDDGKKQEFAARDQFVDVYHVYNQRTKELIQTLTKKPIVLIEYWANQKIWKCTGTKEEFKKKYNLPSDAFVIGSFQRDSEGQDTTKPKLEKGPDLLRNYISSICNDWKIGKLKKAPHVMLAGWRRNYLIKELQELKIPYSYIERPQQNILNELYQTLDVYPVTSRCEGGPQALIECGLLNVPVISRDVGIASQVLSQKAINDVVYNAIPEVPNVESWKLPFGYENYRKFFINL